MNDSFLKVLRDANITRQLQWDNGKQISLTYLGNAIAGEVGEMCNVVKKLEREFLGLRGTRATPRNLADEMADVIIYIDLLAARYGIELDAAIAHKFNETSMNNGFATRIRYQENTWFAGDE